MFLASIASCSRRVGRDCWRNIMAESLALADFSDSLLFLFPASVFRTARRFRLRVPLLTCPVSSVLLRFLGVAFGSSTDPSSSSVLPPSVR